MQPTKDELRATQCAVRTFTGEQHVDILILGLARTISAKAQVQQDVNTQERLHNILRKLSRFSSIDSCERQLALHSAYSLLQLSFDQRFNGIGQHEKIMKVLCIHFQMYLTYCVYVQTILQGRVLQKLWKPSGSWCVKKLVLHGLFHQILRIRVSLRSETCRNTNAFDKRLLLSEWLCEYFSVISTPRWIVQDVSHYHDQQLPSAPYTLEDWTTIASNAETSSHAQSQSDTQGSRSQSVERQGQRELLHHQLSFSTSTLGKINDATACGSLREAGSQTTGLEHSTESYTPLALNESTNIKMYLSAQLSGIGAQETYRQQRSQTPCTPWTAMHLPALVEAELEARGEKPSAELCIPQPFDYPIPYRPDVEICSPAQLSRSEAQEDCCSPWSTSSSWLLDDSSMHGSSFMANFIPVQSSAQQIAAKRRRVEDDRAV
jgi:hypothetical protein